MAAMAPMVPNASITATSSPVPRKHPLVDGVDAEEKVPKRVSESIMTIHIHAQNLTESTREIVD